MNTGVARVTRAETPAEGCQRARKLTQWLMSPFASNVHSKASMATRAPVKSLPVIAAMDLTMSWGCRRGEEVRRVSSSAGDAGKGRGACFRSLGGAVAGCSRREGASKGHKDDQQREKTRHITECALYIWQ